MMNKMIEDAFISDDFEKIMEFISSGKMNIDEVDPRRKSKTTTLMRASTLGRLDVVSWLINHGASIDAQDSKKWTALHFACSYKHENIIKILVSSGANINIKDDNGNTALSKIFDTTDARNIELASYLIAKGGAIDIKNNYGVAITDYAKNEIEEAIRRNAVPPEISHMTIWSPI